MRLQEQTIKVKGGELAAFSVGAGPGIIFLHGGPGDTHHYMARMAAPLFDQFHCIFFDQRGTGGSARFERVAENFTVDHLLDDLCAVSSAFGLDRPLLVGHSWGAMYGLYACIRDPEMWSRAALISMGPLDEEMRLAVLDHLLSVLDENEKKSWKDLREKRNQARDRGDFTAVERFDRDLMCLRVKAWVYQPHLRDEFLEEYFADPPPDRVVNSLIWPQAEGWFRWEKLSAIQAKLWLCSGAEDSVRRTQAERVARETPDTRVSILERCGHMPWLEWPGDFYSELREFLTLPPP